MAILGYNQTDKLNLYIDRWTVKNQTVKEYHRFTLCSFKDVRVWKSEFVMSILAEFFFKEILVPRNFFIGLLFFSFPWT